jgi:hypothetical protein
MSTFSKSVTMALAALALGAASLASATAEASPRGHGVRHGGHGGHIRNHGIGRHHIYRGHWGGHGRRWGGYPVYGAAYYGGSCRIVERVNVYGEVVARRVCPSYY